MCFRSRSVATCDLTCVSGITGCCCTCLASWFLAWKTTNHVSLWALCPIFAWRGELVTRPKGETWALHGCYIRSEEGYLVASCAVLLVCSSFATLSHPCLSHHTPNSGVDCPLYLH